MEHASSGQLPLGASIVHAQPGFILATYKNVLVTVWSLAASGSEPQQMGRTMQDLTQRSSRISSIAIVKSLPKLPSPEVRKEFSDLSVRTAGSMACGCIVLEADGFAASAIRGFMTSVQVLCGGMLRVHMTKAIPEMVTWVIPRHRDMTGVELDQAELSRSLRLLNAHDLVS